MNLKIEYLNKQELKPYVNNAKIHTSEQIEQIKKSIEEFGFNDPIAVWHDNEIIEGHGRLLAAMEMDDVNVVPVIRLDDLTDEERRAYALVHNKLTMNTDFDVAIMEIELDEIKDIDMTDFGFDDLDLDPFFEGREKQEKETKEESESQIEFHQILASCETKSQYEDLLIFLKKNKIVYKEQEQEKEQI